MPLLATCSADKSVRVYAYRSAPPSSADPSDTSMPEAQENRLKFTHQATIATGHPKTVRCVAWSPSGTTLATASFDSNIGIWEQEVGDNDGDVDDVDEERQAGHEGRVRKGDWECMALLEGHETECKSVAYSSSGTLLASCSRDKTVWIWEGASPIFVLLSSIFSSASHITIIGHDHKMQC